MKTLKLSIISALIAISSSAFAGNLDNCCATNAQEAKAIVSLEASEMNLISESIVKGTLKNMTSNVRGQISEERVRVVLDNMTKQVQARVRKPASNPNSL